jgi:energy-coupling factor transporter transmembrane protein EcfT
MIAELYFMGKPVSMGSRMRRRWLVALVFVCLALIIAMGVKFQWKGSFVLMFFATEFVNGFFFGGTHIGGLIKRFQGNEQESVIASSTPGHLLKWGFQRARQPKDLELTNDERELLQRDRSHYRAYRILWLAVFFPLIAIVNQRDGLHMLPEDLLRSESLVYGFFLATMVVYLTLPQAILLWTEPDMEEAEVLPSISSQSG